MTKVIVKSSEITSMYNKTILWPQWLAGLTIALAVLTLGLSTGWTSPYLAQLTSPDIESPLKLSESEASWVASLLNLGRFVGSIAGAISQGMIGRKRTILLATFPVAIGWICMILARSVYWLYTARFFSGIGSGMIWTTISLYLGEIADPSIRGALVFLNTNASYVGSLLGNIMGSYLDLNQFGYISLALIILFLCIFFFIPDSPYRYVARNDIEQAEKSLKWFKRQSDIPKEIQNLKDFVGSTNTSLTTRLREFSKPKNRKNAIVMCILNIFLYFSGHNTMSYYAEIIITKSQVPFAPDTVVIALSLCTVITSSTAAIVVDKFGRRMLLIASSIGTGCALTLLACHFHLLSIGTCDTIILTWLPIFALFLYNCSITYGMVPVPNALIGELFPPILKTFSSMLFSASSALLSFITTRTFQPFVDIMGEQYVFWIFALTAFSTAPFTYFFIIETKGQTLMEIQNAVVDKTKSKNIESSI